MDFTEITQNELISLSNEQYFAESSYANSSLLKTLYTNSAKHVLLEANKQRTPAMLFGTQFHQFVLEGADYVNDNYIMTEMLETKDPNKAILEEYLASISKSKAKVKPRQVITEDGIDIVDGKDNVILTYNKNTGMVKEKWDMKKPRHKLFMAELAKDYKPENIISFDDNKRFVNMRASIYDSGMMAEHLVDGKAEVALFTKLQGQQVKVKYDYIRETEKTVFIYDLKTTEDASHHVFKRTINNMHYDLSAAMYVDAYKKAFGEGKDICFIWIAVEKNAPFCSAWYMASPITLEDGRDKFRYALDKYEDTVARNHYTGYPAENKLVII